MKGLRAASLMWTLLGASSLAVILGVAIKVMPGVIHRMFDGRVNPDGPSGWLVALAAAGIIWLIGWIWLVRIFRGSDGEPPPWRYRDRR